MIRSRLFLQVYVTLLVCLASVAIATAVYWRISADRDTLDWRDRRDQFVERMLPASDGIPELQRSVQRLGRALGADIALYSADGALIAGTDRPPPLPRHRGMRQVARDDGPPNVVRMRDGRVLVANIDMPWDTRGRGGLGYLLLIAAVIGLAGYPVVRYLTRRLERLRVGVDEFGAGALSARVPVEGRDEVAAVARSFNHAATRIEGLVNSHRALLANASHELRSPLARLRMAVDLQGEGMPDQRGEIVTNLREIDELVEEILLASRLDHVGKLEKAERVDLTALAAEECARQGLEASGQSAEVKGDARLLRRMIRNLILNAQKHGRPPIQVEVASAQGRAVLAVRDHGDGLPQGEEGRIFEAFYRPAGRSESAGGWGLGLALVKQIAELHGGTVSCENAQGGGARFIVQLPIHRT